MATGIQTGIRRGSRVSVTASTEKTRWQLCQSRWSSLSGRHRAALIATLALLQIVLLGMGWQARQNGYVDLYPTNLLPREVPEISNALLEMGMEHDITPATDGLLLHRDDRAKARAVLASRNLPRHRVLTADEVTPNMVRGTEERRKLEQRLLEGEITLALRDVEGVQDARVKLSLPERKHFGDAEPARAAVTLTLAPGHTFEREAINGLLHLVAFSVPGLTPDNVQLSDTRGRSLSAQVPRDSEGGAPITGGAHFDVRSAEEQRMQEKLQQALEVVLPGRTRVLVNLDLDFSTAERRLYTPGSEKDDGLVRDSFQLVTEMLGSESAKKDFSNRKESVNYKYTENYIATLAKQARVERVSATVFADGLSPREAASLEQSVRGSLGLKEDRGDFVYVDTTPWDKTMMEPAPEAAERSPLAIDEADKWPLSNAGLLSLLLAQTALMLGGGGFFLYLSSRQRSAAPLERTAAPALNPLGIVDHGRNKAGQTSTDYGRTGVQTTELLEGIVRERPTQVADLLRSTWLSGT